MITLSQSTQEFLRKNQEKKIVFTNGCFDILHVGHVAYLEEAKKLGDLLFVGLNSDASVRRLKGEHRPINNELDRRFVLSSLRSVDCVEIFNEDTPLELIKMVNPAVLVKGGDWSVQQIVGHEHVMSYGGKVLSLTFVDGYSTSKLIQLSQGKM